MTPNAPAGDRRAGASGTGRAFVSRSRPAGPHNPKGARSMTDSAKAVTVELSRDTVHEIAELLPAVAGWAATMGEERTGAGDVVALAVAMLHAQVFAQARQILADDGDEAATVPAAATIQ